MVKGLSSGLLDESGFHRLVQGSIVLVDISSGDRPPSKISQNGPDRIAELSMGSRHMANILSVEVIHKTVSDGFIIHKP